MSARAEESAFDEDDLLPLSALQHLLFCERQCALIHIEGQWAENRLTAEGRHLHERADAGGHETRGALRVARGLAIRSLRLGLVGRADVVEFHAEQGGERRVVPVEYKRGRPKTGDMDRVQLCAQALCLEEMLGVRIDAGALFYATTRRREEVALDARLRDVTWTAARRLHALVAAGVTPRAVREPKCDSCSLRSICLPEALAARRSAEAYLARAIGAQLAGATDGESL